MLTPSSSFSASRATPSLASERGEARSEMGAPFSLSTKEGHARHEAGPSSSYTASLASTSGGRAIPGYGRHAWGKRESPRGFDDFFSVGGPTPKQGPPDRPADRQRLVQENAHAALAAGAFKQAAQGFQQALKNSSSRTTDIPDRSMPRLYAGLSAALTGLRSFAPALRAAETCVQLDPRWHEGHVCRARALSGLGQYRLSAEAFKAAAKLAGSAAVGGSGCPLALKYELEAARTLHRLEAQTVLKKRPSPPRPVLKAEPLTARDEARLRAAEGQAARASCAARTKEAAEAARGRRAASAAGERRAGVASQAARIRERVCSPTVDEAAQAAQEAAGRLRSRLEMLARNAALRRQASQSAEPPWVPATVDLLRPAGKSAPPNRRIERGTPYAQAARGPQWMWTQQPRNL